MLHAEYERFLQSLNQDDASEGVRKMANLVAENIEELAPLGTHQGSVYGGSYPWLKRTGKP